MGQTLLIQHWIREYVIIQSVRLIVFGLFYFQKNKINHKARNKPAAHQGMGNTYSY